MDSQILAYAGVCEALAERMARSSRAKRVGAEYDDLYQEGLISVWLALKSGRIPSAEVITQRMKTYMKYLGRQTPVPYDSMLSLDEERA